MSEDLDELAEWRAKARANDAERVGRPVGFAGGDQQELETAFEAPCARCRAPVAVSHFLVGIVAKANGLCRTKGWAELAWGADVPVCAACYAKHRDALERETQAELEFEERAWSAFQGAWKAERRGNGQPAKREELEREFAKLLPRCVPRMREWVRERTAQEERSGEKRSSKVNRVPRSLGERSSDDD